MRSLLKTCLLLLWLVTTGTHAELVSNAPGANPKLNLKPSLELFSFTGERVFTQSLEDPLLLFTILDNSDASFIQRENESNKKMHEQYVASEEYKSFSDQRAELELSIIKKLYPIREVPQFKLGSTAISVDKLISFQIRNPAGDNIDLAIKSLAAKGSAAGSVQLLPDNSLYYQFGVPSEQLKSLPEGSYQLVAVLDTREQKAMWQGLVFSKPIVISLKQQHPEPDWAGSNAQAILHSNYLMANQHYADAERHARSWVEQHPASIDGWAQLGDALAAQGQSTAALEAWNTAVANFRLKHGDTPIELPQELIERIDGIVN